MTRRMRTFSAAAAAVALITTLALARTTHTAMTPAQHASAAHGKVTGTTPSQSGGSHVHGIMTCGATASEQDCERLEMLLPMSWRAPDNTTKQAVRI